MTPFNQPVNLQLNPQPFQPIAKSFADEKGDPVASLHSPFAEYFKEAWFGATDTVWDYADQMYKIMGGEPLNLHNAMLADYENSTMQRMVAVTAKTLIQDTTTLLSMNI